MREYVLFGMFGGHVNITDGRYVYMKAPDPDKEDELYNYTLALQHMNERFSVEELENMTLREPFSFTKNCRVLRIKAKNKFRMSPFGSLLFDVEKDPGQLNPVEDEKIAKRMIRAMREEMNKNDCPQEQFERLGM